GGPVRLVVPEMYGYKSVKWLERIRILPSAPPGYWEERGYATDAWIQEVPPPPDCGYRPSTQAGPCQ
ncbi:MAG: molybdopterin-dependent oxidoreductase, partial [Firmicutes bacterium]|nr:molybdopterin-dependent oxidoreductase [Bacillota bacterium]